MKITRCFISTVMHTYNNVKARMMTANRHHFDGIKTPERAKGYKSIQASKTSIFNKWIFNVYV